MIAPSTATPIESATSLPSAYARIATLPVEIDSCEFVPMVRDTSSGFTKITTVVRLRGCGEEGLGEDVTWDQIDQIEFLRHPMPSGLEGAWELDELSAVLGEMDLFPVAPCRPASRLYRRWAFESAALGLGLRQAGLSLAQALGRTPRPVRFVASVRLGEPPSVEPILARLRSDPTLEFKLDPTHPGPRDDHGHRDGRPCQDHRSQGPLLQRGLHDAAGLRAVRPRARRVPGRLD